MTTRAPRAAVPAPALGTWRVGLLSVAESLPDSITQRWQGGVAYRPESGGVDLEDGSFDPYCGVITLPDFTATEAVEWNTWGIAVAETCTTLSTTPDIEEGRALRRLEAQTGHLTENTFWTGQVGGDTFASLGWPNRPLADVAATDVTGVGTGVVEAFGFLTRYLAETLGGLRAMIHVPAWVLPWLAYYQVAFREGNRLLTTLADHLVVAGTGYPGTAPNGDPAAPYRTWFYATSMVRVGLSAPMVNVHVAQAANDVEAVASRMVVAEWDLQAHAAVEVCLPDPGPPCSELGS
jgi:hypothetical protein